MVLGRIAVTILLPLTSSAGDVAFSFDDPRIAESSGLVVLADGNLVTTNDSGDVGRVFVVTPRGRTVRVAQWSSAAVDQEAVAPSSHPDRVWVGDSGDNGARRSDIVFSEVGVAAANSGRRYRSVRAVYPDGAHDAETLMRAPDGRLLVVTKGFLGGTLYAVPSGSAGAAGTGSAASATPVTLEQLSSPGAMLAMATDGAFFPDGKHFLVRGYVSATLYAWPSLERLGSMPLPSQRQGEGLAISADSTLWLTSEGARSKVLHLALSEKLAGLMNRSGAGEDPSASASPGGDSPAGSGAPMPAREADSAHSDPTALIRAWPWIAGGLIGVGLLGYLARAWGSGRRRTR